MATLVCLSVLLNCTAEFGVTKVRHMFDRATLGRQFILGSKKLHVSGNGKRQIQIFLAKFSLNVFVSYFLSCVERIIMYFSLKQQVNLLFIA
jgi:hypothetical protein